MPSDPGAPHRPPGRWQQARAGSPTLRAAAALSRRFQTTLLLAAVVGAVTGLLVIAFEHVVHEGIDALLRARPLVAAVVPGLGLVAVALLTRATGDEDRSTTDAYIRAYHQRGGVMSLGPMVRKLAASFLTLGSGHAMGLEGPSVLMGGSVGSTVDERLGRRFGADDAKVLMVAGAAAGVSAVFKAPLTGVVFALEVPYRADLARRALLPSLVAAGTAYVVYASLVSTRPLLGTGATSRFDLPDLAGSLLVGVACGLLARLGAWAIAIAKRVPGSALARALGAGVAYAVLTPIAFAWFDGPRHLGPGYVAIRWALAPDRTLPLLAALFVVRAAATWLSVAGGGAGGLFIPLVVQGAVVGAMVERVVNAPTPNLFPTIGIAALLGAGYRTPLASVAFVAEATGQPGYVVPALLAAAVAQLVMGRWSFSPYQRWERLADVSGARTTPVAELMYVNVETVDVDATLDDVVVAMMRANRRWAPVVDGDDRYLGLIAVSAIARHDRSAWSELTAGDVADDDVPAVADTDSAFDVANLLRTTGAPAVAVLHEGRVVGVITLRELSTAEVLLDRLSDDQP